MVLLIFKETRINVFLNILKNIYVFLGLHGWFPAKLVEVLDERSKEYSFAGDDSVTQAITDLVRGVLCPAVKRIFEHGLRRYLWISLEKWLKNLVRRCLYVKKLE